MDARYTIHDPSRLLSPSLVIFRDIVRNNIATMLRVAGSADRLRPHAKTHKMPAVIRLMESMGITKQKCATIAEAEMIARAGGRDVLIAYPLVGPNVERLTTLIDRYPETTFRASVDNLDAARALSSALGAKRLLPVLIDLEVGMGRTGISIERAASFYRQLSTLPGLALDGLHAYDGHIRDTDLEARRSAVSPILKSVFSLRDQLLQQGLPVPRIVLGGTPTFPIYASVPDEGVECAPGTSVFHDHNYASRYPDLPFTRAAVVFTRVISRPREGRLCLDLGHKAIAADSPAGSRFKLLGLDDATIGPQSEEHLVVDTPQAAEFPLGAFLLAVPAHVCPTSALHRQAYVIENGELVDEWDVEARDRQIRV